MAPYSPNFVFTDPVAASQMVGLAQIAQAEEAARNQALLGTLQALGQQNVARENSAAERYRYMTNADIQRQQLAQQAAEAEKNRAARSSEVDRTITANKDIATIDANARTGANSRARQDASDNEEYNFVLSRVESEDPPTDEEFRTMSMRLTPERAARLDGVRKQTINSLSQAADNAEAFANYWNSRIAKLGANNKTGETMESIIAEATKSQAGKFIIFDPQGGQFRPSVRRPRAAARPVTAPPPESISDIIKRTSPAVPPEDMGALGAGVGRVMSGLIPRMLLPFLPRPAVAPPVAVPPEAAPSTSFPAIWPMQ